MSSQKISLHSLTELKTTLDDHIPIYLSTSTTPSQQPLPRPLRFTPDHTLAYTRLGLGYSAVLLAVYAFYADYIAHQSFEAQKPYLWVAVPLYFALNGAFTAFGWYVERGCVFRGSRKAVDADSPAVKGGRVSVRIDSHAPRRKYDPVYRIAVSATGMNEKEVEVEFVKFFREDGKFVAEKFEAWLREVLSVLVPGEEVVAVDGLSGEAKKKGKKKA